MNSADVKRGLVVGRFQPFHKGHLSLIRQVLDECDEVIIVVGSSQFNYMKKNPFTAGERITMIHSALEESGIDLSRCYIIPIANDVNNARWLAYIKSMVPEFSCLYTGNDFITNLVSPEITIIKPNFINKDQYNGTYIRKSIAEDKNWQEFIPGSVFKLIKSFGGVSRLKMLFTSDSNPQRW